MESQEKKDLIDLSKKFSTDVLSKYTKAADPNEMGKRDLLEITMLKIADAYDSNEVAALNDVLDLLIERGLDTSRRVHTFAYSVDGFTSPTLLQVAANTNNISPSLFQKILKKEESNLDAQPNSGMNLLIGRIKCSDRNGFEALINHNLRLPPELAEEALKTLTIVASDADSPQQKQDNLFIGKTLLSMGPNLFNIRMFNNTVAFDDLLSEKGQEELAAFIKTVKVDLTIEEQEINTLDDAEAVYETTFRRGL